MRKVNRCLKGTFGLVVLLDLPNYNLGRGIMIAYTSLFFFFPKKKKCLKGIGLKKVIFCGKRKKVIFW